MYAKYVELLLKINAAPSIIAVLITRDCELNVTCSNEPTVEMGACNNNTCSTSLADREAVMPLNGQSAVVVTAEC